MHFPPQYHLCTELLQTIPNATFSLDLLRVKAYLVGSRQQLTWRLLPEHILLLRAGLDQEGGVRLASTAKKAVESFKLSQKAKVYCAMLTGCDPAQGNPL